MANVHSSQSAEKTIEFWDFTTGVAHRALEARVVAAQARLLKADGDAAALATLGEWYAFRGMDHWAVDFLGRARQRGVAVAPLTLARCYWNLNRNGDARREFQIAIEQSKDPREQAYLGLCVEAIDTEPELTRRQDAIAAAEELKHRLIRPFSLLHTGAVAEAMAEVAELTKTTTWTASQWYYFACVCSLASAKAMEKKNEYADRAMELLQKAVNSGWNNAKHTANDTDLAPIRDRADFKKLLVDLEKKALAQPDKKP